MKKVPIYLIIQKKSLLTVILFLFISCVSYGQKNNFSRGERYFDLNMFTEAIEFFKLASKEGGPKDKEKALIQLANCYRITGEFELAEKTYTIILKNKKTPPSSYFDYGLALKASSKYTEAIASFEKYKTKAPADSTNANRMIKSCEMAQHWLDEPIQYDIKLVEKMSGVAPDFAANYSKDGVFFCSSREGSKKPIFNFNGNTTSTALDFYIIDIKGQVDSIQNPIPFPGKLNTNSHEGPGCFSEDNSTLFLTKTVISDKSKDSKRLKTLQIFTTSRDSLGFWRKPFSAFSFNSSNYSVGHPNLTKDGKRIYFMSDMPEGHGGTDIYYADIQKNGTWGKPINLGKPVNTSGNELFPFIADDSTLYFSSNMHPGMGKLDVFSTKMKKDGTWDEVLNMRPPINTIGDDFAFIKDGNKNRGFLSSDRFNGKGADDIYSYILISPIILQVHGTDISIEDQTFYDGITFKLVNDSTKEEIILKTNEGFYSSYLAPGVSYTLAARKDGFRYAKVGITRMIPDLEHNLLVQIRPLDKTVKVVGSLIDIDSTWTKNLTSISNSNVTLAENDNDIANQFTDDKSNFYFDYELTSGNTYLLKDDSYKEIKKPKTESDTLTIIVPLTKDSLVVMNDSIYPPEDILFKGLLNSDGKKLSNVSLKLYQGDSLQALAKSDGMGMFSFPINTAEPKYTIFASKPGYESREIDINALDFRGKVPSIVRIEMVEKERIDVSGVVKSKDSVVANAQLDIFCDIESTKSQITDNSGSFKFSVNPDGEYSMMVNKKGYLPTKVDIPLENINENGDLDLAIELDTLKINQVFTMNIYYEFDKSDIKPKSEIELDRFISFMRINPSVKIEISAHTDEKGTDQYNMSLSRERANKVMNYLIYEGKVEKKRIISNGYGESKLIIKNAKTEEENQMNRRTEIRILGF